MSSLREIQCMVRDAIFEAESDGPALQAISAHINASPGITASEHLRIYRRAILGTLVRALGNIYPVCKCLVGEQFFDGMARVYARQTPSRSPDLANYGQSFSDFIAAFEPAAGLPYLPDTAVLEWHWHRAFHAADEPGIDLAALGEVTEKDMSRIVFKLPASASLIASDYPVHRIWEVNQADWEGERRIDLDEGGVRLIVWRQDYDMRIDVLDEPSWWLLNAVAAGTPFGALSEAPNAADLDTLLPGCVQHGWIGGFDAIPGAPQ